MKKIRIVAFFAMAAGFSCSSPIGSDAEPLEGPCGPCDGWWDIGHRKNICPMPSEGLFQAKLSCIETSCAVPCVAWVSSYDACMAATDPACQITVTDACNTCLIATNAAGGCHEQLLACGDDCTGASTCAAWVAGIGDPQTLCARPIGGSSLDAAFGVMSCACDVAAPCEAACKGACDGYGYLDPIAANKSKACAVCLKDTSKSGCGFARAACLAL